MAKEGRRWFALDVNFTKDATILDIGEGPAWAYLAILGHVYASGAQGVITALEIDTIRAANKRRVTRLVEAGLLKRIDETVYLVPAWEAWQPDPIRAKYMRDWRRRQKQKGDLLDFTRGGEPHDPD